MILVFSGTRHATDYDRFCQVVDDELRHARWPRGGLGGGEVWQGGARGIDAMARRWAEERGLKVRTFEADWAWIGAGAGPVRNREMVEAAAREPHREVCFFALPGPQSRGTIHFIDTAMRLRWSDQLVISTLWEEP